MRPPHSSEAVQIPSGGGDRTTVAFKRAGQALPFWGRPHPPLFYRSRVPSLSSAPPPLPPPHRQQQPPAGARGGEALRGEVLLVFSSPVPQRRTASKVRAAASLPLPAVGKIGSWTRTLFNGVGSDLCTRVRIESFFALVLRWIWFLGLRFPWISG